MGTWSVSIAGNDTALDLLPEYSAVFSKFEPDEGVRRLDSYVRTEMFDESDEEEWCNYVYSLAGWMWKKGILTVEIKKRALRMLDTGFGLGLWAEAGAKTLEKRKKALAEFREKILSPVPPGKKIKPDVHPERIFESGDLVAIQLQTAGKSYTEHGEKEMSDGAFHAFDGKYVLMQLMDCFASWESAVVPEVKDYWAVFRLFDGVYDGIPEKVDPKSLKPAKIHERRIHSCFTCESSMFYFKKRKYRILGRFPTDFDWKRDGDCLISFGVDKPWNNPDSQILAAMGKEPVCGEFDGTEEQLVYIVDNANRFGKFNPRLPVEENEKRFSEERRTILRRIEGAVRSGGRILSLRFGNRIVGVVTVSGNRADNLYVQGGFQGNGFGTRLLKHALSNAGERAYVIVPEDHKVLSHICEKLNLKKSSDETEDGIRYGV